MPPYAFLHSADDVAAGHFRRCTLRSLTRAVIGSGFRPEHATYLFAPLPPFVLLLRTLPSLLGLRRPADAELQAHEHVRRGLTARTIDRLLGTEARRIRATVERDAPVARATARTPPRPDARASTPSRRRR